MKSPGRITRLTVSVVVDGTYKTDDKGNRTFVTRTADELKRIEDAVKQSVGYSADREDLFSISCMPFVQEAPEVIAEAEKAKKHDFLVSLIKPIVYLLGTVLVLFFVVRPLLRWLYRSFKVGDRGSDRRKALAEADELPEIEGSEVPQIEAYAKSDEMKHAVAGKRKAIERTSKDDMNTATAVVKSWLQENV